jgi:hypothetical protein
MPSLRRADRLTVLTLLVVAGVAAAANGFIGLRAGTGVVRPVLITFALPVLLFVALTWRPRIGLRRR